MFQASRTFSVSLFEIFPGLDHVREIVCQDLPILEIKKCCSSWSISFITPKLCWRFVIFMGIFLFSAVFIACLSTPCTIPTKSLDRYDQILQLGPFFFPNRSGINLSAPPTEYVTSSRLDHENCFILDALPGVLQKLAATVPEVHG